MNVICFGNLGYLGTVLNKTLESNSSNYVGFDTGYFKDCTLRKDKIKKQIFGDVRKIRDVDFSNFDTVIYLAALSDDPLGSKFIQATNEINFKSCLKISKLAKASGVKKFIFASSCSIYGKSEDRIIAESDKLNPLTNYAKSKINAENKLKEISSENFTVTCLRFATACGFSNRMRLDIVLNNFISSAILQKKIVLNSNGESFRPLIHVNDIVRAIVWACQRDKIKGGDFLAINIGCNEWNFKIIDLAKIVSKTLGNIPLQFGSDSSIDPRSYKVDFSLFKKLAPNFQPIEKIENTITKIFSELSSKKIIDKEYTFSRFSRLSVLNDLIQKKKINDELYWNK